MATSTYDHLDEGTLELRVKMWRPAIEYCFKKSDVVTNLAQHGLLNAEETNRLIEIYDQKPSQDAASEMFQILFKKCIPRKWKTFVDALTETGYDFVVSRLKDEKVEIADERERGKQLLLSFGPFLERDIDPKLLIPRLVHSKVIKNEDADKIENTTHSKSKAEGVRILLQRIQCYMAPRQWWDAFLTVLWETEFEHVALLLEPDYYPSSKKLGPIIDESEGATGQDDVQEHVMKDRVDAQPYNDLNAPPESMEDEDSLDENVLVEQRVKWWRHAIVRCIKTPNLASRLAQYDVIDADDKSRLVNMYQHNPPDVASNELIEIVINKKKPSRKWQDFIKALEDEGLEFVKSRLIPSQMETPDEREHGRKLVQLFGPELEQDIDPVPLLSYLKHHKVIQAVDADEINNLTLNKSKVLGMMLLLDRVQCYLKPSGWWEHLLCALWINGYEQKVKELDPDFIPSKLLEFDPRTSSNKSADPDIDKELIMTDQVDAETDNDLNAPPVPARTHSLVAFEDDARLCTRQTTGAMASNVDDVKALTDNFKEFNIKPERMKHVDDVAHDSDGDSVESNEWDSDNGGSDIDEGDENQVLPKRTYEPRDYQLELAEKALGGLNTIICAETGTGKTWVALYVIDKHLSQASKGTGKVAFMARTGVLIKQQSNRFKKFLPHYRTKLITGDDEDSRMVDAFIPTNDIMCFTPQILVNNLDSGNVSSLSKFSLLVFDECHHTRGDEPYARLARKYLIAKGEGQKGLPQIVGLTASIGVGKSRTVEEAVDYILRVCASLDVRPPLSTVERCRESFKKWVNTPEEETIKMIVKDPDPCKDILISAMEVAETLLEEMMFFQPDMIDMLYEKRPGEKDTQAYNKWTVDIEKSAQQNVNDHQISRDISACAVYLNVYNSAIEVSNLLQIAQVAKYLADKHRREAEGKKKHTETEKKLFDNLIEVQKKLIKLKNDKDAANPNVQIVSDQLQKMIQEKGDDSRAIVFVKARATCRALADFLDKDLKKIGVKASPLYGQQTKGADEGMTESVQTEILQKFRDGYYKVMVCTSVGTEGIDVPDCNIVINYNYSGDEITKIQMKGRSRKKDATIVVMGDEKQLEQEMINAYKADMMYKAIGELKKINARAVEHKVKMFQTEEMQKHRYKTEYEKAKKSRRSEDDLEIMCKRCNTIACLVSDVRKLGSQHFVIAKDFSSKVTTKPHKSPKKYDGIEKKGKMYCKQCPLDWGIVADRDGIDLFILKLQCLKLRNMRTGVISQHKKWLDVPFEVPELGLEDIPKFFRKETEASTSAQ